MLLKKLSDITQLNAFLIIFFLGFVTFFSGLNGPFIGDDNYQIVNNKAIHSISNIKLFLTGGTFYNDGAGSELSGSYYRPLMITIFSTVYTVFKEKPVAYHFIQLTLYIFAVFFLFLFLQYSFKTWLALLLSLIFLVHPINSLSVFYISALQDVLFFLFGIIGLWLLLRFSSKQALIPAVASLFLCLLAKETGMLFVIMSVLYLIMFDRERLKLFLGLLSAPLLIYFALRTNAIELLKHATNAPITDASFIERLLTIPSITMFYFTKLIFPYKLGQFYYWVNPGLTFKEVILPMVIVLFVVAGACYLTYKRKDQLTKAKRYTLLFYIAWLILGLGIHMQIVPLDMTASEAWFIFPFVGFLGILGVLIDIYKPYKNYPTIFLSVCCIALLSLSARTIARGFDWRNVDGLNYKNISASKEDFNSMLGISGSLTQKKKFVEAEYYARKSIGIFSTATNNIALGNALASQLKFDQAAQAYMQAIVHEPNYAYPYRGISFICAFDVENTIKSIDCPEFIRKTKEFLPNDPKIWTLSAIMHYKDGQNQEAKDAIDKAALLGEGNQYISTQIMLGLPLNLSPIPEFY